MLLSKVFIAAIFLWLSGSLTLLCPGGPACRALAQSSHPAAPACPKVSDGVGLSANLPPAPETLPGPIHGAGTGASAAPALTEPASSPANLLPSPSTTTTTTSSSSSTPGGDSLFESSGGKTQPGGLLSVRINVPHNTHPVDVFTAYPYPVKPPRLAAPPSYLPVDRPSLKGLLLSSGYSARISTDKAYPTGGWRWQYAYNSALKKSKLGLPHTILTMYQWIDAIMPCVAAECRRSNEIEDARWARYQKAVDEFEQKFADIENEAVRKGLYPVEMPCRARGFSQAQVPPGSYWLTCTRKVPGLTYYWREPVEVAPGAVVNLMLTESNALEILGGW